jgi:hypothetical protein
MNILQHRITALLLLAGMGLASTAEAALVSRLGGDAVYDTDLNITWLADANYAKTSGYHATGLMSWDQATAWVAGLTVDGVTGWRLPTALNADGSRPDLGYNVTGSELGHLFYNELGGVAGQDITTTHNANFNLFNNIQSDVYWSGTEFAFNSELAWFFYTFNGSQYYDRAKYDSLYGWAVHSGDVAAVPEPEEYMMMLVGGCAIWLRTRARRRG